MSLSSSSGGSSGGGTNAKSVVKEILDPDLQKELLVLEEQEGSINFKFGIVYAKRGQLIDDEMFANGI